MSNYGDYRDVEVLRKRGSELERELARCEAEYHKQAERAEQAERRCPALVAFDDAEGICPALRDTRQRAEKAECELRQQKTYANNEHALRAQAERADAAKDERIAELERELARCETEYHAQADRAEKAERERDEALTALASIVDWVNAMSPGLWTPPVVTLKNIAEDALKGGA